MLHISMFDSFKMMSYPCNLDSSMLMCPCVFQARRHTTEIRFDQLRGRPISEVEKDTITSLSTENLNGETYDDGGHTGEELASVYIDT